MSITRSFMRGINFSYAVQYLTNIKLPFPFMAHADLLARVYDVSVFSFLLFPDLFLIFLVSSNVHCFRIFTCFFFIFISLKEISIRDQ